MRYRHSLAVCLWLPAVVMAGDYSGREDVRAFADEMAKESGYSAVEVRAVLDQAVKRPEILEAIAKPAEKTKPWKDYRNIFITSERIDAGTQFWSSNEATLKKVAMDYQVDADMIVAIIGIETFYGKRTGKYRALDALSTLAFDYPPRAPFFRQELKAYLLLAREQHLDPLVLTGSYAGAMGYGQFMPSSYRNFAVDFDGDHVADIWNNQADAIASVASYFQKHKWRMGQPVALRCHVRPKFDASVVNSGPKTQHTVAELAAAGFTPLTKVSPDTRASILQLDGEWGPEYWMTFDNFYVITRYNKSQMYALSAYQLSDALRAVHDKH